MATINIITEDEFAFAEIENKHPWILRRCALEIEKYVPEATIIPRSVKLIEDGPHADINYFINYALLKPCNGIKVGHYTHLEKEGPARKKFLKSIPQCDYYTVTCDITANILKKHGAATEDIYKIPYGSDDRFAKDIVFGVVGTVKPSGRKGEYLVENMLKAGYNVKAWGYGWPCPEENDWDALPDFYRSLDYLLVSALNEGGPVPVIDAIRAGVPVIAPDVGWCWELPVIRYKRGDWESLSAVLKMLTKPPTWDVWAKGHKRMFDDILSKEKEGGGKKKEAGFFKGLFSGAFGA